MAAAPHWGAPFTRFVAPRGVPLEAPLAWSTWRRRLILARSPRNRGPIWYPQQHVVGYFARPIFVLVLTGLCGAPWGDRGGSLSFLTCAAARFQAQGS